MLHIHCGAVNSGKTQQVLTLLAANERAGKPSILIVPDPATYSYERKLIERLGHGFTHVRILSFNRFCEMVLMEKGQQGARRRLTEAGRSMLVWLAVNQVENRLTVLKAAARQKGFCQNMARQIAHLYANRVWNGLISRSMDRLPEGLLKNKLNDLSLLFNQYDVYLNQGYTDHYDQMLRACHASENSPWLAPYEIFIDGFDMLNKNMLRLVMQLVERQDSVHVSVSMEAKNPLYALQNELFSTLTALAETTRVRLKLDVRKKPRRLPEFAHLEEQFGRYPFRPYPESTNRLRVLAAKNPEEEVLHAAREILAFVREGGRFAEVSVLCADIALYRPLLERIFPQAGVPVFVGAADPLMRLSLVRTLFYALKTIVGGWQKKDLAAYLQSALAPAPAPDAERLLFLADSLGVRPYELQGRLRRTRYREEFNMLADRVLHPLYKLERQLKVGKTSADYARALLDFVSENKLDEELDIFLQQLTAEKLFHEAHAEAQALTLLQELLDEQNMILADQPISPEVFAGLLEEGLKTATVGVIPSMADSVSAGRIADGRFASPRFLLMLGATDGALPVPIGSSGYITDAELEELKARDFDLSPSDKDMRAKAMFDVYAALLKPTERLYVSYPAADGEGDALRPALVVGRLRELFPKSVPGPGGAGAEFPPDLLLTPRQGLLPLALSLNERVPPHLGGLYALLAAQGENPLPYAPPNPGKVPAGLAKSLYGLTDRISATRLEKYAQCPFAHFVAYGLRPAEIRPYQADSRDVGALFHQVLGAYADYARRQGGFQNISRDKCHAKVEDLFTAAKEEFHEGVLSASALQRFINTRLCSMIKASAWAVTEGYQTSGYKAIGGEIAFGPGKAIEGLVLETEAGPVTLYGFIDRADRKDNPPRVRVVDYKTSPHALTEETVAAGATLQLPLYLLALSAATGAEPASAFYFLLDELAPDVPPRLSGIAAGEEEKEKGVRLYGEEGFAALLQSAYQAAAQLYNALAAGESEVSPLRQGQRLPCDYCDYARLCAKDPDLHAGKVRRL